jgi:glucose-1-phosphatase
MILDVGVLGKLCWDEGSMPSPALLFDIGNVLVTFDFSRCANALALQSPLSADEILAEIAPLKDPLESGEVSGEVFVTGCMKAIRYGGSAEQFQRAWCDIFALNAPMAVTLDTLPRKLPSYLFSNTSGLHADFLLAEFPVFAHFQGGIMSHLAKTMKPAVGMYEQAVAQYGLVPEETFYVDDLLANIETGRRLGFRCFHYDPSDHAALDAALRAWLVEVEE